MTLCIGEHPHGLFHLMHSQWRLYRPFIMWTANFLGNKQVVEDPTVSVFNVHRFYFLHVLTRACAEYILEIAATPGADDLDDPFSFIAKAEANDDFAWICHFVFNAGFFVLDFLTSVRGNDSHKLDLLWREFFASAHSGTANKTQYVSMSILRVFWGMALVAPLDELYHKIRTIPSGNHDGSGVGWDWSIEMLNAAIKEHVKTHVSEVQIQDFLANWALIEAVLGNLKKDRAASNRSHYADPTKDVDKLKQKFREVVGTTWQRATRVNTNVQITAGPQRQKKPWNELDTVMRRRGADSVHEYVKRVVSELTPFYAWG